MNKAEQLLELVEASLEIPDNGIQPYELIKLAKKQKLIKPPAVPKKPIPKPGEYIIIMKDIGKKVGVNPLTGRKKKVKYKKYVTTDIKPNKRTLKNMPTFANGKSKVRFQDWLELKKDPEMHPKDHDCTWGWSSNGSCYGWSHRAVNGFKVGQKIKPDTIGNSKKKEWVIQTQVEAEKMAKAFAKDVS